MRLGLPSLALFVLPLACSFDSSGQPEVGSGGDDEIDVTTGVNESGGESGTDQGTSASTESTTDPTTESTTESTTDPTTDTTDTTTDTTDTTTDTTTTDTGEEPPYGDCNQGSDCAIGEACKESIDPIIDPWKVCAFGCDDVAQCPDAGGLPLTCLSYAFQPKTCFIDCGNASCPVGMTCKSVNIGQDDVCVWEH